LTTVKDWCSEIRVPRADSGELEAGCVRYGGDSKESRSPLEVIASTAEFGRPNPPPLD
jgi:hypothetical protein